MYKTLLLLLVTLTVSNLSWAETLVLKSGETLHGRVGDLQDDIVKFYADKYYAVLLSDIRDVYVDDNVSDQDKVLQQKRIDRLEPVLDRVGFEIAEFENKVNALLLAKRFFELDDLAKDIIKRRLSFPESGVSKLNSFYLGLKNNINTDSIPIVKQQLNLIQDWVDTTHSQTAKIALISLSVDLAWAYRGDGYSNTVARQSWAEFKQGLEDAAKDAENLRSSGTDDPMLYSQLLNIYKATGKDATSIIKLGLESAEIYPEFYPSYYSALSGLMPKWGGSKELVKRFIRQLSALPQMKENRQLYFRMVRQLYHSLRYTEFVTYQFDWEKVQASFDAYRDEVRTTEYDYHLMAELAGYFSDNAATLAYLNHTSRQWNHMAENVWGEKQVLENFERWAETAPDLEFAELLVKFLSNYDFLSVRDLMKIYVAAGGDINKADAFGNTLLIHAVRSGYPAYIDTLITMGADVNKQNVYGYSSVYYATNLNRLDLVPKLLNAGANLSYVTGRGNSLAHVAAGHGFDNLLTLLINKNSELLNKTNKYTVTPLYSAIENGHLDTVNLLANYEDIDINIQSESGDTPLHYSIYRGNKDITDLLIKKGADPNIKNKMGHTALSLAKKKKLQDIVEYLEDIGAEDSFQVVSDEAISESYELYNKSSQFFNSTDYAKAEEYINEAIRKYPGNILAYHGLAALHLYHTHNYQEARKNIDKAIELGATDPEVFYVAGRIYHALNMPDEYKSYFQKYVDLAPDTYNSTDLKNNYSQYLRDDQVSAKGAATINKEDQTEVFNGKNRLAVIGALSVVVLLLLLLRTRRRNNQAK